MVVGAEVNAGCERGIAGVEAGGDEGGKGGLA